MSSRAKAGRSRVASASPGAHREAVNATLFVGELDKILRHFTRRSINRSGKGRPTPRDFVQTVFRAADPDIGSAAIEEAMKRVIKGRGRTSGALYEGDRFFADAELLNRPACLPNPFRC